MRITIGGLAPETIRRSDFEVFKHELSMVVDLSGSGERGVVTVELIDAPQGTGVEVELRVLELDTAREVQSRLNWLLLCVVAKFLGEGSVGYRKLHIVCPVEHLVWLGPKADVGPDRWHQQGSMIVVHIADLRRNKEQAIDEADYELASRFRDAEARAVSCQVDIDTRRR